MGGGIGMGNTCKPMAVSFQCMTKSTTIKKKKKDGRKIEIMNSVCKEFEPAENSLGVVISLLILWTPAE